MRAAQKKQILDFVDMLEKAHQEIKKFIEKKAYDTVNNLLADCQDGAITIGNLIEESEGEGFVTVHILEEYCELLYHTNMELAEDTNINVHKIVKKLDAQLTLIKNSVNHDIPLKKEIVFLPYKASMWDSLESVWMAADKDPNCDAYVIPIPYFDKNNDVAGAMHYEADLFPDYVPITAYDQFDFENRRPDIIYIHNPYDEWNMVTTVHPFFYSKNIKKFTDLLVYIPYYATSGGTGEGQALCPAYVHADYMIVQSENQLKYFDPRIPKEKFIPLGSPKFDRTIRLCNNLPEAPADWKAYMQGKKIYFYNTSISGMLADTERFLKKMEYVFSCFRGRQDACLLWRPHPLLEATFDTLRADYKARYLQLKHQFIEDELGIYDNTPDIENTIALSDAYIGDSGTSVTSLFGVAGKPMFIFNNNIHSTPTNEDIEKEFIRGYFPDGCDEWQVSGNNKLFHSPNQDYQYRYVCDLSEYGSGFYYMRAIEANGKLYICPGNGCDVLILDAKEPTKVLSKINLKNPPERGGSFAKAMYTERYIFLIPLRHTSIVRIDTTNDEIAYLDGYQETIAAKVQGEWIVGGSCIWKDYLLIASPVDHTVLKIHMDTLGVQMTKLDDESEGGCLFMSTYEDDIYMVPYIGTTVLRWNIARGDFQVYDIQVDGLECFNLIQGCPCMERPFSYPLVAGNRMILAPHWGNMFVEVDLQSGQCTQWDVPVRTDITEKSGYLRNYISQMYLRPCKKDENTAYRFYNAVEKNVYDVDIYTKNVFVWKTSIDKSDLKANADGFDKLSQWLMFGCEENSVQTLNQFLGQTLPGNVFDAAIQKKTYEEVAANNDGTCGEKILEFCLRAKR